MAKKKAKAGKGKAKQKPTPAAKKGKGQARKAAKLTPIKIGKAGKKKVSAKTSSIKSAPVVHEFEIFANAMPKKIPENQVPNYYCAVEATSVNQLTFVVQNKINEGWIPTGGVTHSAGSFVQALVRY